MIGIPRTADAKLAASSALVSFEFAFQGVEYLLRLAVPFLSQSNDTEGEEKEEKKAPSKFQALLDLLDDEEVGMFVLFGDKVRDGSASANYPSILQVWNEILLLSKNEAFKTNEVHKHFSALFFTFFERERFIHARSGLPLDRMDLDEPIETLCAKTELVPECRFIHSTMPNAPTTLSIKLLVRLYGCSHSEHAPFVWTVPNSLFLSSIAAPPDYKQIDMQIKDLLVRFFPETDAPFPQLLRPQSWVYLHKHNVSVEVSLYDMFTGIFKFLVTETHITATIAMNAQVACHLAVKNLNVLTASFDSIAREKTPPKTLALEKHKDMVSFLGAAIDLYNEEMYDYDGDDKHKPNKLYFFDLKQTKHTTDFFLFKADKERFTFLAVANWFHFFPTANKSDSIQQSPFFPGSPLFQKLLHRSWMGKQQPAEKQTATIDPNWLTLYRSDKVTNVLYPAALLPFGFELSDSRKQCVGIPTVLQ